LESSFSAFAANHAPAPALEACGRFIFFKDLSYKKIKKA
jgi:hypothetical protein